MSCSTSGNIASVPLLDDYGRTDPFKKAFLDLEDFVSNPDKRPSTNEAQFAEACLFAGEAIEKWKSLHEENSQKVYKILGLMSTGNKTLICIDEGAIRVYQNIVAMYVRVDLIKQAIGDLCIFLTPARRCYALTVERLKTACNIIRFAVKFFLDLTPEDRVSLNVLHKITLTCSEAYETDEKSVHTLLIEVFDRYNQVTAPPRPVVKSTTKMPPSSSHQPIAKVVPKMPSTPSSPAPKEIQDKKSIPPKVPKDSQLQTEAVLGGFLKLIGVETLNEEDFVELGTGDDEIGRISMEKERERKESIRKKQIDKIHSILFGVVEHYGPYLLENVLSSKSQVKELFLQNFKTKFSQVSRSLFINPPGKPSRLQKDVIVEVLSSVGEFLRFLKGLPGLYVKSEKETLEQQSIKWVNELKKLRPSIEAELAETVESFCRLLFKDKIPEFCFTGIGMLCVEYIGKYFTPSLIGFVLDRLLGESFDLDTEEGPTPPISAFNFAVEPFYTKRYGDLIGRIINECLELGKPSGTMGVFANLGFISLGIDKKKVSLGEKVQQFMAKLKASECTMTPFLILKQLMFNGKVGAPSSLPLFDYLRSKPEEKESYNVKSKAYFNKNIYNILISEIGSISKTFDSIEEFCATLCSRFWQISQSQELMMKGLIHVIKGIKTAIERQI